MTRHGTLSTARAPRWGIGLPATGVLLALVALICFDVIAAQVPMTTELVGLVGYLVVWVPLVAVAGVATLVRGTRSPVRDFGIRFHWIDLLWGIGIGLLLRFVTTLLEVLFYGHVGGGVGLGAPVRDGWWWFAVVIAPVVIAPFVEESYFRGFLQPALRRASGSTVIAIGASALVFTLLHLVGVSSVQTGVVIGISTLLLGIATGVLAFATSRIGGAIIAHAAFNAAIVIPLLFAG